MAREDYNLTDVQVERIKKWTAALRSGKYKQWRTSLRRLNNSNEMCCLGVACEVAKEEQDDIGYWNGNIQFVTATEKSNVALPQEIFEFYGLSENSPKLNIMVICIY